MGDSLQLKAFYEVARELAAEQLKHHVRVAEVGVVEAGAADADARALTAQILVAGTELEILFGLHFDIEDADRMLASRMQPGSGTRSMALDLVRELTNLVSGRIKALVEGVGVAMAQGLPFMLRGKGDVPTPGPRSKDQMRFVWGLTMVDLGTVICSITVFVKSPAVLAKLGGISPGTLPTSGDVEVF